MKILLDETEVKKAVKTYLTMLHGVEIELENMKFYNKQEKPVNLGSTHVVLTEKEVVD